MNKFEIFECYFSENIKCLEKSREEIKKIKKQHNLITEVLATDVAMLLYTRKETTKEEIENFLNNYIYQFAEFTTEEKFNLKNFIFIKLEKIKNMEE